MYEATTITSGVLHSSKAFASLPFSLRFSALDGVFLQEFTIGCGFEALRGARPPLSRTRFDRSGRKTTLPRVSRTIVIGDVHGCSAELGDLLQAVSATRTDRIVFVGDLVGRGPDSLGVLARVRQLGAVAVQGNHERRLLDVRASEAPGRRSRLGPAHRRLMQSFTDEDWHTMASMPLYAELSGHQLCVVHAGIDPTLPMSQQDPWVLTHIRSIDDQGAPSHRDGAESWAAAYAGPIHIAFGHNALRGLQLHEHATGLDTGCVYGGRLSALVLQQGQAVPSLPLRQDVIVSVAARHCYFDPRQ